MFGRSNKEQPPEDSVIRRQEAFERAQAELRREVVKRTQKSEHIILGDESKPEEGEKRASSN